ncbi:MAG: hypothetical protein ABIK91_11110 [Pseudomonadota bacterium]
MAYARLLVASRTRKQKENAKDVAGWKAGRTPAENARAVTPLAARPVPYVQAA